MYMSRPPSSAFPSFPTLNLHPPNWGVEGCNGWWFQAHWTNTRKKGNIKTTNHFINSPGLTSCLVRYPKKMVYPIFFQIILFQHIPTEKMIKRYKKAVELGETNIFKHAPSGFVSKTSRRCRTGTVVESVEVRYYMMVDESHTPNIIIKYHKQMSIHSGNQTWQWSIHLYPFNL